MTVYKQRLLNIARALRESPAPDDFSMSREFHGCGTPACAWGHYVLRSDLQDRFTATIEDIESGFARTTDGRKKSVVYHDTVVLEHFGIDKHEAEDLFSFVGCGSAQTTIQAAKWIEKFAARKWPSNLRTDSDLVRKIDGEIAA